SKITWAVIDSGIDGKHSAFQKDGATRVKRSFDFKNFRQIVSLSNAKSNLRDENVKLILDHADLKVVQNSKDKGALRKRCNEDLATLAQDAERGVGSIHWGLVEQYVEIDPEAKPPTNHGTHVAGIIGASREAAKQGARKESKDF